jgi:hypothetical protein
MINLNETPLQGQAYARRSSGIDAKDISRLLATRIESLVLDLLPAGKRDGHEWRVGSIGGEPGNSLGIHLTGAKAGVWADFSSDHRGDALDLVRAVLRVSTAEALRWARRWLGIEEGFFRSFGAARWMMRLECPYRQRHFLVRDPPCFHACCYRWSPPA